MCDVFDVGCAAPNSVWSGSFVPESSPPAKPWCLKMSRSANVVPGTSSGDGCVQLVGMLERGAVTGHYCRSNRAIDLFVLMPGSSIELQPEILVGLVSGDEIQGRFYVRKSNDPDEGYSPARGFRLKRVNACPTN
jgi:hypothetical protein